MTCAFLALITMADNQDWQYIILPIGILIWGVYIFFKENDDNYLMSKGIDPKRCDSLFGDYYDDYDDYQNQGNNGYHTNVNGNTITWDRVDDLSNTNEYLRDYSRYQPKTIKPWSNPSYKGLVKKCKRNFKITIDEDERKSNSILHRFNNRK